MAENVVTGKDTGQEKEETTHGEQPQPPLTRAENVEFQEFHKSLGMVGSFTKQMVKLAIDQLRPEFEKMAGRAAERVMDSRMMKVKEMQDELNRKEKELLQMKVDKRIILSRLDREKQQVARGQQAVGVLEQKDRDIKRMEADISALKGTVRKRSDELKRERERATTEESKRLELESSLQAEIDRLRRDLDKVKGHLGQIRSAKNVGDEETRKLRERERNLIHEIEELKSRQGRTRQRKYTR